MYKNIFPLITEEEVRLPFYLISIGGQSEQETVDRPDGYPSYHWLQSIKGKGMLVIDGNEYSINENMCFLFHPGIAHKYHPVTECWETRWITFEGYAVQKLVKQLNINGRYDIFQIHDSKKLDILYDDIFQAAGSDSTSSGTDCSFRLYRFLIEFNHCVGNHKERLKTGKRSRLEPVILYMQKNYSKSIGLEELSTLIDITPQHLCRLFRQAYNLRPFEYLAGIRLQAAKGLLTAPGNPRLEEIARQSGYNDTSYFCAVFKEMEGITPIEFRRLHGKG